MAQRKTASRKKTPSYPWWVRVLRKIIFTIAIIIYIIIGIVAFLAICALIQFVILVAQLHIGAPRAVDTASAPSEENRTQVLTKLAEAMPHLRSEPAYSATYDTCFVDSKSQKFVESYLYICERMHIDLLEDTENQSADAYSPMSYPYPPASPPKDYRLRKLEITHDSPEFASYFVKSPDPNVSYHDAVTTWPVLSPPSKPSYAFKHPPKTKLIKETGRDAIDTDKTYFIVNSSYIWYKKDIACSMLSPLVCEPPVPLDFSTLK